MAAEETDKLSAMTLYLRPLILALMTLVLLNGCATMESTTNVQWQTHQKQLAAIEQYRANGKLGYIAPDQRQSLNFQWHHASESNRLRLTTFLGQTVLLLEDTPTMAKVETMDEQTFQAPSAQTLIEHLTGLSIPVDYLHDWLLGRPTQADDYTLNPTNTLATLTKTVSGQTWQLEYQRYQDVLVAGLPTPLPQRIALRQGDTTINIIISTWTLN